MRGNAKPSKLYVSPEISVREIRNKLNLSQDDFAAGFGFTIKSSVVSLIGSHEIAYLEHCRKYATQVAA